MKSLFRYCNELDPNRKIDYLLSSMSIQDVKRKYVSHNYSFSLDIESIDQFIILDDNVDNNNINLNNNFVNIINNLNNCDTDELVSFETVVENFDSNDTSTIISNEHVLTPDNDEQSVEVEIFGKKKRKKDDRVNKLN
ncbi:hypothetical protein QTP88_028767 [Uroleucon formosanum]